jgi:hypothetical protein
MKAAALERVEAAQTMLIAALDASDAAAIEAAAAAFADCVDALAAAPGALDRAETAERAIAVRRLFDQSQMRVNFLTDVVRRRLDRLASVRGREHAPVYDREGR